MANVVRLGVEIPKGLHQTLKSDAKAQGKLFSPYIEELLRRGIGKKATMTVNPIHKPLPAPSDEEFERQRKQMAEIGKTVPRFRR